MFFIVAFYLIEIYTCLAPQNDHQHLSFVKDIYVVCKKMTRNGYEIAKVKGCLFYFEMEYTLLCLIGLGAFSLKFWPYVWLLFKSGFKSRAGYDGARMLNEFEFP